MLRYIIISKNQTLYEMFGEICNEQVNAGEQQTADKQSIIKINNCIISLINATSMCSQPIVFTFITEKDQNPAIKKNKVITRKVQYNLKQHLSRNNGTFHFKPRPCTKLVIVFLAIKFLWAWLYDQTRASSCIAAPHTISA